ncbi:hypothetical protein LZ198_42410 [Myxococcus sp. K15C18031901]|uniref:hypothetical protein n=1 Tax=Myxococcus dinghuensis TaxID=2906761 RepID=UPI0020A7B85A|nr:hypothetical protein [Myxococcus dinghuensis]MCP3105520.1 hypothetical protein [Myxococcus dinghuensis]
MLISLFVVLSVAAQAPAAPQPQGPLTVLVAPPDAAGAPAHVVEFAQEHVAEQLESRGLRVIRIETVTRKLAAAKRRALLRCHRTEPSCIQQLGAAGKTEVVLVAELGQFDSGYRVGARVYGAQDGALITEQLTPGVPEEQLLDALTQALDAVVPRTLRALRGPPPSVPMADVPPPTRVAAAPATEPAPSTAPAVVEPTSVETGQVKSSSARRWAWLPAAGGVALAGVGTVFYLKAKDRFDTLDTGGSVDAPLRDASALASQGRNAQTVSRVAFGLGAAGLVAGAVMFLWPDDAPARVQPSAAAIPGGGMVGVSGTLP